MGASPLLGPCIMTHPVYMMTGAFLSLQREGGPFHPALLGRLFGHVSPVCSCILSPSRSLDLGLKSICFGPIPRLTVAWGGDGERKERGKTEPDPLRQFPVKHCILADCILLCGLFVLNPQENEGEIWVQYNRTSGLTSNYLVWGIGVIRHLSVMS